MNYYDIFSNNFNEIIYDNDYYKKYLNYCIKSFHNILLYTSIGFPIDIYIDEIIKGKFNLKKIYKNECLWEKNVIYYENQYFFEIDLYNPEIKDYSFIDKFISSIIKTKNLVNKHFIIIKNIDLLNKHFNSFRIILEKYYNNVYFLCSTFNYSFLENPIKSRFNSIRLPLFKHNEIKNIFKKLNIPINRFLLENKTRNIINALFITQVEKNEPHLINYEFCNLNYPPLLQFIKSKKYDIEDIKTLSYKLCQYNITICQLTLDLLKIFNSNKKKQEIIKLAIEIDNMLVLSNKGREPIYIECYLSNIIL
jgi:hypothetical protein